ncbi:transcriptional regulator ATRX isoform X2 [Agrilus planipennis]|uniref:ATP-dependent helicase ATRX n=1 Tax=Agrilus planipennis TaxID=224129 RepID=A0A1W4WBU0_AGRPL|nr:transcriptional regulator ATRX isoform X2 [Agrilus planipennis]
MTTSKQETNFRMYYDIDKESIRNELYCTICGISIKLGQKVEEHPVLKVAVCKPCLLEYNAADFNKNDLCVWCGEKNNTLRRCFMCKTGFCKKCLSHNLDDKGKWEGKWFCLKCDTEPIWPLRNIFVKADLCSRKQRSLSQEKILPNEQPLRRLKRSKSVGCALSLKGDSLANQISKETMKNLKKTNYQTLQDFLRIIAKDMILLFNECNKSVDDFKLDVFQPYTTKISQIISWFSYLCFFIDSVNDNLNHLRTKILKESVECKNYDGILLLSDYRMKLKKNGKKVDTSPDSMVLPFSSSSQSSQDDLYPLQSTSQVKKNSPKNFRLSLKNRRIIYSSDESSDEVESSTTHKKTFEEIQEKKKNSKQQSPDAQEKAENKLRDMEAKDEAAILKELEDSNKKREENKQGSSCSESTEIYSHDFLTARDSSAQFVDSEETIVRPNYGGLEICPETGYYIGGTVPDSSQSSSAGLTDSDTQSFVFDIPDNLLKSVADIAGVEAQAVAKHAETEKGQNENGVNSNNLETNTNEGELIINVGDHEGEIKDKKQVLNENKDDEINEGAELSEKNSDLKLDANYVEEKIDVEEEKPRKIDSITDDEVFIQENSMQEVKDEDNVEEQINKILNTVSEYTNYINPSNVDVKEEYNYSTDELEDLLSESDENEKDMSTNVDEEKLKKAFTHLQNDNFMTDVNITSESSLDVSSDDSFSDSDGLNAVCSSKEQEKVLGRIVSLPLQELIVQNNSLNDSREGDNVVEEETGGTSTDNTPDILPATSLSNEQDEKIVNEKSSDKPFVPKSCCVLLDRLPKDFVLNKLREMKMDKERDIEDAELKKLLNLKTLDRKRRHSSSDEENQKKRQRNSVYSPKITQQKDTSSSSEDDQFYEDSDEEGHNVSDKIEEIKKNSETQDNQGLHILDEIAIRHKASNFLSSDSEDDSDAYDDEEEEENEKKKTFKKKLEKDKEKESEKDKTKEKTKSTSWRSDPLLRQRFEISLDSEDSDTGEEKKSKSVSKKKQELVETIEDDLDIEMPQRQRKRKKSYSSSFTDDDKDIKTELSDDFQMPASFNSNKTIILLSSSDSDIEFITDSPIRNKAKSRKKNKSESENDEDSLRKKGRKNIREILSDDVLEEDTKKAIEEEKQRNIRVSQKQQLMSNFLSQSSENLEEEGLILDVDSETQKPLIVVNHNLSKRLKNHQSEGVKFMWSSCYESVEQIKQDNKGSGCILAHCMGLGKTFQVITLIHTLFKYQKETRTKCVLVVCPLSTVLNWENEFKIAFNIASNSKRPIVYILGDQQNSTFSKASRIKRWHDQGGILVMGYEAYSSALKTIRYSQNTHDKINAALVDPGPDLVILDEGHLLKNGKTSRTITLMQIKTKRRIILTGTPMQNNLKEYYHMVNFVKPNLLGSWLEYSNQFVNPIVNGQYDDSTEEDVRKMKYRSHVLNKKLKRTIQRFEVSELETYLPPKLDYVLFVQLHPVQVQLYQAFLENLNVDVIQAGRLFAHYHYLQNVWSHPYLLVLQDKMKNMTKDKNIKEIDTIDLDPEITMVEQKPIATNWWSRIIPKDVGTNIEYGSKFYIMLSIIEEAISCGDKIVVFSNSLNELDGIEHFLKLVGTPSCKVWRNKIDYYRMDGTIKPDSRMSLCMSFNNPKNTQTKVFLVSHKVGGLGLNLVAANRVILMDVNWNPSYESQSIFRTYRFGQKKTCYVYRLVSMGTMEEVVYERSVTKLAVAGRVVDERQISRHYKSDDLQKMYRANFDLNQLRPNLNVPEDVVLGKVYQKHTKELFKYHSHQALLENLPHESLTEEEMERAWLEFGRENEAARKLEISKQFIENAKKNSVDIRYQKNIETINALAEDVANKGPLLNSTIMRNGNFLNIPNTSMSASLVPAACRAFAKENLNNFISSQKTLTQTLPLISNVSSASRNSSTQVGQFEEVFVPTRFGDVDANENRDNDVIVLEDNSWYNPSPASVDNNKSSEYSKTDGRIKASEQVPNKNRFPPSNRININLLRKPASTRLVPRATNTMISQEVIDVENHSLLAKLAKNHDISVSQILKPKIPEVDDQTDKGNTSNNCDNVVETSVILL